MLIFWEFSLSFLSLAGEIEVNYEGAVKPTAGKTRENGTEGINPSDFALSATWAVGYFFAGFQVAWILVVAAIIIALVGMAIT